VYRRQQVFPNNYYFYIRDLDWGPAFLKTVAYAPFPVWIYLNGNEWAKQQATQHGIAFGALDNGFASCENSEQLAAICHSLSAEDVRLFFERWQAAVIFGRRVTRQTPGRFHTKIFNRQNPDRLTKRLVRQLEALGHCVTLEPRELAA
jgi:hypothetical protein